MFLWRNEEKFSINIIKYPQYLFLKYIHPVKKLGHQLEQIIYFRPISYRTSQTNKTLDKIQKYLAIINKLN